MFGFGKNKSKLKNTPSQQEPLADDAKSEHEGSDSIVEPVEGPELSQEHAREQKKGWFKRLSGGLKRTRANITDGLANLVFRACFR